MNSKDKILQTIVAFANTAGGKIVIGISDKEHFIVGVIEPHSMEEKLANLISDCISPQIVPNIEIILWGNKYLIVIDIYPSPLKPYFIKQKGMEAGTYIRVGSTTRLAGQETIDVLARSRNVKTFDEDIIYAENSEAINFRVASEFFRPFRNITESDLLSLGILVKESKNIFPSKGGLILFGEERYKYFPDSWIQAGCFKGIDKSYIIDKIENKIHMIVKEQGPVSTSEIAKLVGLSARTIRTRMIKLIEKGLITEISRNSTDPKKIYISKI